MKPPFLSFAIPVYGCPEAVKPLCSRIHATCQKLDVTYEVVMVDDRCPHGSWTYILNEIDDNVNIRGVRLSRNFGQHAAIQAAISLTKGDWIVVMDCDLQDRPEEVPALLEMALKGWHIVQASRGTRKNDSSCRRLASFLFYKLLSLLTGTRQNARVANFGVYSRACIDAIRSWDEETKYFPAIVQWVGFSRTIVEVTHDPRFGGESSYNISRLLSLATNVVVGFSDRPLKLLMGFGLAIDIISVFAGILILSLALSGKIIVEGWASIILSLWFIAGWVTFSLGMVGTYIGRILVEAKGRPNFIIEEVVESGNLSESLPLFFV